MTQRSTHRETGYGTKITKPGSLQVEDGAREERGKSLKIFDDISSTKNTKPLVSRNTKSRNKCLTNSGKQYNDSVWTPQKIETRTSTQLNAEFRVMEYDASAEMDELNRIRMQEFPVKAEEAMDA